MTEVWRSVEGFESYEVSNKGRVRNKHAQVMRQFYTERGDAKFTVFKDGKKHTLRIARLVAFAFLDDDLTRNEVNHIDGNPRNNLVDNLEWSTRSENMQHAYKLGLYTVCRPVSLYCVDTKIRKDFKSYASCARYLKRSRNFIRERIKVNNLWLDRSVFICNFKG